MARIEYSHISPNEVSCEASVEQPIDHLRTFQTLMEAQRDIDPDRFHGLFFNIFLVPISPQNIARVFNRVAEEQGARTAENLPLSLVATQTGLSERAVVANYIAGQELLQWGAQMGFELGMPEESYGNPQK